MVVRPCFQPVLRQERYYCQRVEKRGSDKARYFSRIFNTSLLSLGLPLCWPGLISSTSVAILESQHIYEYLAKPAMWSSEGCAPLTDACVPGMLRRKAYLNLACARAIYRRQTDISSQATKLASNNRGVDWSRSFNATECCLMSRDRGLR